MYTHDKKSRKPRVRQRPNIIDSDEDTPLAISLEVDFPASKRIHVSESDWSFHDIGSDVPEDNELSIEESELDEDNPDEEDLESFFNDLERHESESSEDENDTINIAPVSQADILARIECLVKGTHYHQIKDTRPATQVRGVTTTQFAQVAIKENFRMSKDLVNVLHSWINSDYFQKEDVRKVDTLKNRRRQLFPLLRLYVLHVAAKSQYIKRAKQRGYATETVTLAFPFLDINDTIVRDLSVPGRVMCDAVLSKAFLLQLERWANAARVGPKATEFADGRLFRSSPLFTFDCICCNGLNYALGADVQGETSSGLTFFAKITSIFLYHKTEVSSPKLACYLKQFVVLDEMDLLGDQQNIIKSTSHGPSELVLLEREVLFRGRKLNKITGNIVVVDSLTEFQTRSAASSSSSSRDGGIYLCRYGMEDEHLRPLRLCPASVRY